VIRSGYQFFTGAALRSLALLPALGKCIQHFTSSFAGAFLLYEQTCVVALLTILHQANLLSYSKFSLLRVAARLCLVSWQHCSI
jgi:hypothetical protein